MKSLSNSMKVFDVESFYSEIFIQKRKSITFCLTPTLVLVAATSKRNSPSQDEIDIQPILLSSLENKIFSLSVLSLSSAAGQQRNIKETLFVLMSHIKATINSFVIKRTKIFPSAHSKQWRHDDSMSILTFDNSKRQESLMNERLMPDNEETFELTWVESVKDVSLEWQRE